METRREPEKPHKSKTEVTSTMSISVIHVIEESSRDVKEEKFDKSGTKNSPIVVTPFGIDRRGSKKEPICLELEDDEVEVIGESNYPISVDDYHLKESLLDLECFEVEPSDPKGKKPKRERSPRRRPRREVGESSNPSLAEPDAYCCICMEAKFKYECFSMKNCSHLYCSACVCQYVEAKVEENETSIGCPDPSCKDGHLELEMCCSILKPETFNRWGIALCEEMIGARKFYCPFKDCSALLIDEGEDISQSECPHCYRLFCAKCKVPWHLGVNCEEFMKLGADERGREDIMLKNIAKQCKWQRCPKCGFYVERTDGCMFIKCRCGHQFCYGCATAMTVDHYCKKCRR